MQERAVASVLIAAKVQPGCREIGGEAEHLYAGGTGGFFRQPELERGVAGGGEVAPKLRDRQRVPGGGPRSALLRLRPPHPQQQPVGDGQRRQGAAGHRGGRGGSSSGDLGAQRGPRLTVGRGLDGVIDGRFREEGQVHRPGGAVVAEGGDAEWRERRDHPGGGSQRRIGDGQAPW